MWTSAPAWFMDAFVNEIPKQMGMKAKPFLKN
jgi:hypothetical protein